MKEKGPTYGQPSYYSLCNCAYCPVTRMKQVPLHLFICLFLTIYGQRPKDNL